MLSGIFILINSVEINWNLYEFYDVSKQRRQEAVLIPYFPRIVQRDAIG